MSFTGIKQDKYDKVIFIDGKKVGIPKGITSISTAKTEYGTSYLTGTHHGVGKFIIQGGTAFGGSSHEWWAEFPDSKSVPTQQGTSRLALVKLINEM